MATGVTLTHSPTTLTGSYSYVYGPATGTYSVTNLGTVTATGNQFPGAIYLKLGGSVTNGSGSATGASVTGFGTNAGVAIVGAPGTVDNFGTIDGGSAQRGVRLYDGGTLVNGSPTDTTAIIRGHGFNNAVGIGGSTAGIPGGGGGGGNGIILATDSIVTTGSISDPPAGTVINYGTIGNSDDKAGVAFGTGSGVATVINGSTADTVALIASGSGTSGTGVYIGAPVGGTIVNFATIGSTTSRTGIYLGTVAGAVTITNGSTSDTTALITGGYANGFGVGSKDPNGLVNVRNFGTISATAGSSIYLGHGGTVTNGSPLDTTAVIQQEGTHANVYVKFGVGTITNYGTIGDAAGHSGVSFGTSGGSGTVINGSTADTTALIIGGPASGPPIYFGDSGGGTVINFATIGGPNARTGIYLGPTAGLVRVTNGSTSDTSALITGGTATGSALASNSPSGPIDLLNYGTIAATVASGINLGGGGTITNGSVLDTAAAIRSQGTHASVYVHGGLTTVVNYGTIGSSNGGTGVAFASSAGAGVVINGSTADQTALIMGGALSGSGISSSGATPPPVNVQNFGTIAATASGAIAVNGGGTITNGSLGDTNAVIRSQGTHTAVYSKTGTTTVINFATIAVATGAVAILFNSGAGSGTVINAGTIESVGFAGDSILFRSPGGKLVADPGAVFIGDVDAAGGGATVLELAAGATTGTLDAIGTNFTGFIDITVDTGARWHLTGHNAIDGGQTLTVSGTLDAATLDGVGNVALAGGTAAFGNLGTFLPIGMVSSTVNTLIVSGGAGGTLVNAISGLGLGDRIEVAGVTFDGGTLSGSTLDLTNGGSSVFTLADVSFTGVPHYNFGTDGTNGNSFIQVACFAAGTRILTVAGEVPVEALSAGMLVPSLSHGRPMRVKWVGHRQVNCAAHPRPQDVWPVRVAAHAFAPDLPHRDVLLSPDHAVALSDGFGGTVLIPARYLVNGATIAQEPRDSIFYYHVELESHGVLLAEGLACESYLDTGNRSAFRSEREGATPALDRWTRADRSDRPSRAAAARVRA